MVGLAPESDADRDRLRRREAHLRRTAWLRRLLFWDGLGPLLLVLLSLVLQHLTVDEAVRGFGMFLLLVVTAILRSSVAWKQAVAAEGVDPPSTLRQQALAGGIVCLLIFELAFLVALNLRGGPPTWLWYFCAGAYLLYFIQVAYALRPA